MSHKYSVATIEPVKRGRKKMSEIALQFTGTDLRGLLDVLLEALKVIRRTGRRPTITINGKLYASHDLRKIAALLPDEDLQPHHQASVDVMFAKKQFGYRRTAYNIAERINSWRTEEQKQVALKAGRTSDLPVLEPFPFRHRGFSERTIRALMDCSIDVPERLLFMKPADLKKIPGLGKASVDEIIRYRAKFIRSPG
jgi:hypothetical protein